MLLPSTPRYRPSRAGRKPRLPFAGPPPPPVVPVAVVSVTVFDEQWADWEFSLPVTLLPPGSGDFSMIQIDTSNGTQSASEGVQVAAAVVRFHFDDSGVAAGQAWRVTAAPPPQLDLHGATLVVPANGLVVGE